MKQNLEDSIITRLGALAERPDDLKEIGKRLVIQAVKSATEEKLGQKTTSPMVVRRLAAGEIIPPDLLTDHDIPRLGDKAASGWDKSWLNLIIWDKSWAEDQEAAVLPITGLNDPNAIYRLETILTPDELEVVQKLKIAI